MLILTGCIIGAVIFYFIMLPKLRKYIFPFAKKTFIKSKMFSDTNPDFGATAGV